MSGVGLDTTGIGRPGATGDTAGEKNLSRSTVWANRVAAAAVATAGAALGLSQLVSGAYSEAIWAPIALGALGLVVAIALASSRPPPATLLGPVLGLWLWSLVSSSWSESHDGAHIAANRWLLYASAIIVLWWAFAGDRRRASLLLTCASVGVLGVAAWMLARMLGGHGASLFLGPRLTNPLGYVNGQGGYLLAAAWPCLALAERRGTGAPAIAAAGMTGLVALLGLGLLCQSRSWEVALPVTVVVLEAVVPGRRRRAIGLLLAAGAVAVIYRPLADVWQHPSPATGLVTTSTTHRAAAAIIVAALAAGAVWGLVVYVIRRFAPSGTRNRTDLRRIASAGLAALALLAVAVVGVRASAIAHRVHSQYEAFVHLSSASSGGSRLFSGAGNRYDYWRVALMEFRSAPVIGVGAGNYDPGYYLHRRTTEAITQPHSLELQTLAELGLVGAVLLGVFLTAVASGLRRTARAGRHSLSARWLAVAAGGTFTAWLVQTSVDWMHLIPGLTGIALAAAVGLALRPEARPANRKRPGWVAPVIAATRGGRGRVAAVAAAVAIALVGALTIAPRVLSLRAQSSAERALAQRDPQAAIANATTALRYDSRSVPALVLRSAGFARLDEFAPSLSDLRRAAAVEPRNWATWGLIGDLLTRRGDRPGARAAYRHALALDPLEPDLKSALARVTVKSK